MQNRLIGTLSAGREEKSLADMISRDAALTCMFGAFVFLQFTTLGLANHAGEGFLSIAQRELVYYGLQIFVISGYLLYSLFFRSCRGKQSRNAAAAGWRTCEIC